MNLLHKRITDNYSAKYSIVENLSTYNPDLSGFVNKYALNRFLSMLIYFELNFMR